ncbi:MAG: DMT family transporter, partial [Bdellovibrionales bacterium]|nr:DMT family transporter [Bdellovibrionales bacterium]
MSRTKANLLLLWISVFWGSTFTMVKGALETIGPSTFIAYRFTVATLLFAFFLVVLGRWRRPTPFEWKAGFIIGVVNGLGFLFQTIGLQFTSAGKAGFITGLYIIFVPLFSAPLLGQRVAPLQWLGVLVATLGLGALSMNAEWKLSSGDLWVMGCAVLFAFQVLAVSRYAPDQDPALLTFVQFVVVAAIAWVPALLTEWPPSAQPLSTWGVILFTAVFATVIAFFIQMWAQPHTSATAAALIMALEAVFAAIGGWIWAGEQLNNRELVGCALMLTGMLLVELRGLVWQK